jgi:hypothetical protein
VKRTIVSQTLLLLVALLGLQLRTNAQTNAQRARSAATAPASSTLMSSLPESDAVAQVKVKRLVSEAMPRMLAGNPAKLAEANAAIERFKTRTGLDPKMFDQLALGMRFTYPSPGITKLRTVALANGEFSAAAMVAAGRVASNGKYREEKYQGKTIYIFTLDENIKLFGLFDFTIRELAACPLDGNVLALGDATSIKSVVDINRGRKKGNAELVALATKDPNAVIGFGANLSPQLMRNIDIGNAPIANDLSALRQAYGSVATTEKDVELFIAARATNGESAKSLGDTLDGLKQFGALFVGRLSGAKGVLAKSALSNLRIDTQGNEIQIRTAVAQADVGPIMGN